MVAEALVNVTLYVQDINREVAFYRDVLGLKVLHPKGTEEFGQEGWVELDAGGCILALHGGGKGRVGEDAPKVTFAVTDVEAARQVLVDKGVVMGEVREIAPAVRICSGEDPEGVRFFLEQV